MKCPNCEYNFLDGNVCPDCGIDVVIYEKTLKISNVLYNKGLNLARIRDLSGSMDSLTKSIQFNKNNYYARNLLGLVYFEVGKIGDALKQWVISVSLMKSGNPAARYIDDVQRSPTLLDDYNDAIDMYNRAFLYIQQKSDDLAIIQLKKALDLSPGFLDAMNLLTFCYLIQGEVALAAGLVEKALDIDAYNPVALNYYNELYPGRKRAPIKDSKEPQKPQTTNIPSGKLNVDSKANKRLFGSSFFAMEVLCFVVGGLCALALLYFTYIPGALSSRDKEIANLNDKIAANESAASAQHESSLTRIDRLQKDKDDLMAEIAYLNSLVSTEDKSQKIALALSQYNSGDAVEAARTLYSVDPSGISDTARNQYNELKTNAYRSAASILYNEGLTHFNAENNEDARRSFENCLLYAPSDAEYIGSAVYFLGQLAERDGDIESAVTFYKNVVDNYPQSNRLSQANARLSELNR